MNENVKKEKNNNKIKKFNVPCFVFVYFLNKSVYFFLEFVNLFKLAAKPNVARVKIHHMFNGIQNI